MEMLENSSSQKSLTGELDRTRLILAALHALLIGLAFGFGKIVRDCSLTCNVGYQFSPVAIIAIGILAVPVSAVVVRLAVRFGYRRWQIWSLTAMAASFFIFWGATYLIVISYESSAETLATASSGNLPVRLVYLGFYIWLGAVATVFAPNIKNTVYRLFKAGGRTKALAFSTASLVLGGLIGSSFASVVIPFIMRSLDLRYELARDSLILGMGVVILFAIPVILIIDRRFPEERYARHEEAMKEDMAPVYQGLSRANLRIATRWIALDAKLRRMAALVLVRGIAETTLLYLFYWLVTEQTAFSHGRSIFFANFYIVLNASTLMLLVFAANRFIKRFGLILTLLLLPCALFLGTSYLIVQTIMVVTYILRITDGALEQSLYGQGIDWMMLEVDESRAPVVRPLLQGLAVRVGRSMGAVFILVLALGFGISSTQMAVYYLLVIAIWIMIALSLRSQLRTKPLKA